MDPLIKSPRESNSKGVENQTLTDAAEAACTNACTSEAEIKSGDALQPPRASAFALPAVGATDPELQTVLAAWAGLPAAMKAGILAMIRASAPATDGANMVT